MRSTRRAVSALFALLLAVAGLAMTSPAQAANDASVSILHAIPGQTVDVYVNGKALLTDFKPGTLTDPQMLPAGSYDLKVTKPGAGAKGTAIVEAKGVKVPGGANITVVANLSADGKPALNAFVNDTSKVPAGMARLTVRHTAAAPAVDVRAGGKPVFKNLTNPKEASAQVPAGTVKADVVLAGTDTVAIGPASLDLAEGTSTVVYAWGSAADKNLKLAVQTIAGVSSAPGGMPGGTGGQAAEHSGAPVWAYGLVGVAMIGVLVSAGRLVVVRSEARR